MSNFSYAEYVAQREAATMNNSSSGTGAGQNQVNAHYLNEYLKNDGDVIVVRFPYRSTEDFSFESTHLVETAGSRYPVRVRCEGQGCPHCMQGIRSDIRFFVKCLAYTVDDATGSIKIVNCIWDRPAAFADIELKNLMQEYGDLSKQLFKVRRSGTGVQTRYTISIVVNSTVYNPEIYKADFSELNKVDAVRMCTRNLQKSEKQNNTDEPAVSVPQTSAAYNNIPPQQYAAQQVAPQQTAPQQQYVPSEPVMNPAGTNYNGYQQQAVPNTYNTGSSAGGYVAPTQTPVETGERRQTRYTF